ncbi:response regulator [Flavobacterium sp.]|uniref:response regulator n=1 Tax=Flavobacterium sp. TaxID=239 RepID=UPI00260E1F26|nr:response regulator [Flavobacterium sp.]
MKNKINHICIIDDDRIYQYLAHKIISETNLVDEIDVFSNGLEAINFLKSAHSDKNKLPDIILLDLFMPVMDGWGFLKEYILIKPELVKKIPIYIVSSSIDPADIQKSKSIKNVTDFIVKPMTRESFVDIVGKFSKKVH